MNNQDDSRNLLSHSKGKVFDVIRPGRSLAQPTSRPVLPVYRPGFVNDQFIQTPAPASTQTPVQVTLSTPPETPFIETESSETSPPQLQSQFAESQTQPSYQSEESAPPQKLTTPEVDHTDTPQAVDTTSAEATTDLDLSATVTTQPQTQFAPVSALVAETTTQQSAPSATVVAHAKKPRIFLRVILVLFFALLIAAIALNFILDAGLITAPTNIPHTELL